jgi:DNA-directed RNA polymerase
MDATNNGLQILSMLTRCEMGCKATNVIRTDGVADIYQTVAYRAEALMKQDARDNHPFAASWLDYGISRATTKRPVMCISYGLTRYSNRQYILDWFEEKIHADGCPSPFCDKEYYSAVHYLANIVWRAIDEVIDLPKRCMKWLQDVSKILSKNQRPLLWSTPSGFIVKQDYKKLKDSRVVTYITGEALWVRFKEDMDDLSPSKQAMGVSPNLVHSLDSAMLHLVTNAANDAGIYDFSMIHDSYGTHCKNTDKLAKVIREVAEKMFSEDFLRIWLNQIKEQNPDLKFPEPPEYGSADISLIRDSPYFFS